MASGYEFCRGESPVGTHVCTDREMCKRFLPTGYGVDYADFWVAAHCEKFELKPVSPQAPLPEEAAGLDW